MFSIGAQACCLGMLSLNCSPGSIEEVSKCLGTAKYLEVHIGRMLGDCLEEKRTTLEAVCQDPKPEVSALARAFDCSPCAANKREVQKDDRIRRTKPNLHSIVGSQVAIHDPSLCGDKLLLNGHPLIARCYGKTGSPKHLVQLDYWESSDFAEMPRKSRFASAAAT
jgi:hypothetical protein